MLVYIMVLDNILHGILVKGRGFWCALIFTTPCRGNYITNTHNMSARQH